MRGRSIQSSVGSQPNLGSQPWAVSLVHGLILGLGVAFTSSAFATETKPVQKVAPAQKAATLVAVAAVKNMLPRGRDTSGRSNVEAAVSVPPPHIEPVAIDTSPDSDLLYVDPDDWAPEHPTRPASAPPPRDTDRGLDPEPDAAIMPPPANPSKDPLDHPPAGQPPTGSTTPIVKPAPAIGQAEQPLPELNAAVKAALDARGEAVLKGPGAAEARKERAAIAFFYAAHGFAPAWSDGGKAIAAVDPVMARLARASEDALTIPAPPKTLQTTGSTKDVAASDLALTEAVVAYARQATGSRVDPASIGALIGAKPDLADPAEILDSMIAAGAGAGDRLQALNPSDPRYVALRQKLSELHAIRLPSTATRIPPGPTLRIGMHDARVPLIRSRLSLGGSSDSDSDELRYDTEVAAAVADFQRANGLPPSGALTKRTLVALSGGEPSRLEGTVVANMEMWRWMPRDLGANRIEVNVPEFTVRVFQAGHAVASNRVVVGKTATPTPLFSNTMKYLIVNPVWNVPQSIVKKEFLPKSDGDPDYLASHGFDVSYRNGQIVVKQPAGAKNALGRIKFMFPNDYSVYLHDTPSKSLFASSKRAFSHGCVRVDQPFAFAESVLNDGAPEGDTPAWSQKRLQKMLGDRERYVYLPQPLPIHIEYFTAVVDPETGQLKTLDDVYDYARRVESALASS